MKKLFSFLFLSLLVLVFCFANPVKEESISNEELKIVSLNPNVTEIICALGCQDNLVGRTDYCNYPESVTSVSSIGSLLDPNIEKIISLEPDVVIASSIIDMSVIEILKDANIKAYQFYEEYNGLEGAFNLIREVAQSIGKEEKANEIIEEQKKTISDIQRSIKDSDKSAVLIIAWGDYGDYAATGDTFINDIFKTLSVKNIAEESSFWSISKELLLEKDPSYIFITPDSNYVPDMDIVKAFETTEPYCYLSACKNHNVYLIDGDAIQRQGIRTLNSIVELYNILYPASEK